MQSMTQRVLVTGIGMISAIGRNVDESLRSLMSGTTGIGPITRFETIHKGHLPIAEVKMTNAELLADIGHTGSNAFTRTALLGMKAAREAAFQAGIPVTPDERTGLVSATTVGGMDRSETFYGHFLEKPENGRLADVVNHDCGDSTERIARHLGITGFTTTVSTACSSSVNAVMFAANMIRTGRLDRAIAGGTDSVTRFTLNGFNTLMILDKTGCHPFDDHRAGLTLGEGAAYLVLESEESARLGNRKVLGEILGYGNANDAYHQTASSPEGTGARMAMSRAIAMSGLSPADIDYINVHGTGTQNNDLSEGVALKAIFGENLPPFSSTKGFTGHTLGAAGSVEMVISILAMNQGLLFPNPGFTTPMKELEISPVTVLTRKEIRHVLSNSFGFGGNNSSVVMGSEK